MQKFPLTGNGKLDKKLLPKPEFIDEDDYITPKNRQEQLVCEAFAKTLGLPKIGINDDFFSLGGNSIQAIRLIAVLQENFDVKVADIFNLRTPQKIAKSSIFGKNFLQYKLELVKLAYDKKRDTKFVDIKLQKKLDIYSKSIENLPTDLSLKKPIHNIFLTGSTGYLGCNILNQLLELTNYKIYLPIRAISQAEASERINRKYQFYFDKKLNDVIGLRVFIIKADIEKNYLGLSKQEYATLATKIDSTIHAAALVKHYGEYDKFYSANVVATINLLEFTKLTELKDFHYISTIGVLNFISVLNNKKRICIEDDLPNNSEILNNVYVQTKLHGEHQIVEYRDCGLNCNIYRVGNLAFISKNYRGQENIEDNAFYNWLKCLFMIKCSTEIINTVEISQTDLTAQAIVKIFDKKYLSNQNYHVFNPYLFDMIDIFKDSDFKILSTKTFIDCIERNIRNGHYYNLIVKFLLRQGWLDWLKEQKATSVEILQNKTQHILKELGFTWTAVTEEMLYNYADVLKLNIGDSMKNKNKAKIFSDLERLAPLIPTPLSWLDIDGVVLGGNDLTFQGVGAIAVKEWVIGKTPREFYPKDVAEIMMQNIKRVVQEKKLIGFEESIVDVESGKIKWWHTTRAPLFDDNGTEVVGVICSSTEITERKENARLSTELNKIQKTQIIEQEKFKKLAYQVVHDIRSPLASLAIIAKACEKDLPEDVRLALREAATRISGIASNLLNNYKQEKGCIGTEKYQPIMITLTLSQLLIDKKYQYKNLPIKFIHDFAPSYNFMFMKTGPIAFKCMISNLINNAVDAFNGKAGEVKIKLVDCGEMFRIVIEDNGKGMSREMIEKIMNDVAVTEGKKDGHGIGLTQVRETIQNNKGAMCIDSEIGKGTSVTLSFFRTESPEWIAEEIELIKGDTVIILDDDSSIHSAWETRFKEYTKDINLKYFISGNDAIEFIKSSKKNRDKIFLLVDYELLNQDLNGLDIIKRTKMRRAILVTSHYSNQSVIARATKIGIKILPKQLAAAVSIKINKEKKKIFNSPKNNPRKADLVIIDDDKILIDSFVLILRRKNKIADKYYDPFVFLKNLAKYPKNTKIFMDNDFHSKINGIDLAKQLHEAGYTRLYLFSGKDFEEGEVPDYLPVVLKTDLEEFYKLVKGDAS